MTRINNYVIALMALMTAVACHLLFPIIDTGNQLGLNFFLFVALFIFIILILRLVNTKSLVTLWPMWFCLPILWYAGSVFVYENAFVHVVAPLASIFLTVLLLFWLAPEHYPLKKVRSIFPKEILIFVSYWLAKITAPWKGIIKSQAGSKKEETTKKIILAILISVPFIFIFGSLFIEADLLYREWVTSIFDFKLDERLIGEVFRDLLVLLFAGGIFYAFASQPRFKEDHAKNLATETSAGDTLSKDNLVTTVFLVILNLFFLTFIMAQMMFFFGGHEIITQRGITYAEYVHQGFFQLAFVTALVLLISYIIYRKKENHEVDRVVILILVFILQTMVIVASALKRLWLYQEVYGLTHLRFLVWHFIIYLALILITLAVFSLAKKNYHSYVKAGLVISIIYLMFMTGINMEAKIAKTNIDRYLADQTTELDIEYLHSFSADAYEQISRLEPEINKWVNGFEAEGYKRIELAHWSCWYKNYRQEIVQKQLYNGEMMSTTESVWDAKFCPTEEEGINWFAVEDWLKKQREEKGADNYIWQHYTVSGWRILSD
ncbi:MAG: DUF4173 domain-containing protein [Patescibacteria group bacterium]